MKCLWCNKEIGGYVIWGKEERTFQACDEDCAHDLTAWEKIETEVFKWPEDERLGIMEKAIL